MLKFGEIVLRSKKPRELADFLSFIFDSQISSDVDENANELFILDVLGKEFVVKEGKPGANPVASFSLLSTEPSDIDQLKQKVEFFYYKNSSKHKTPRLEEDCLVFFDPDNRLWRVKKPSVLVTHLVDKKHQDVRHF